MMWMAPVVKDDSSEARETASEATSSGVTSRDIGWRSTKPRRAASVPPGKRTPCIAMRSSKDGVAIVPGQIALQRTPCTMKSAATDLVRPITAALVALYTARFGTPFTEEAVDAML